MCAGCGEGAVSDRTCQKFRAGDFLLDDAPWLSVWLWWWLGVDWPGCSHRGTPVIMPRLLCSCLGGVTPLFVGRKHPWGCTHLLEQDLQWHFLGCGLNPVPSAFAPAGMSLAC